MTPLLAEPQDTTEREVERTGAHFTVFVEKHRKELSAANEELRQLQRQFATRFGTTTEGYQRLANNLQRQLPVGSSNT